jgi:UDP-N-acetylmuramoyl-tripeptide--D-alanyl-D-alanine ligase
MLYNALASACVAENLGLDHEQIKAGISKVVATAGRGHIVQGNKYTIIDDCYNANPSAMKSAIKLLALADTRKVAILGDMFELGENAGALHKEVGVAAGESDTDVIICVGELSKSMFDGAIDGSHGTDKDAMSENEADRVDFSGVRLIYFKDKDILKSKLPMILQKGDSVLIKASHGMGFGEIVDILKEA